MAIVEVVKYNGSPDVFAWKYPSEELGTWTQLIVNESQEAILFKGGTALDIFESGRYTLDTSNIPILNNIVNIPFGGRSPFAAEIWYINKIHSLDIKWGTASPIQLQDAKYGIFIPVRSFGQFGIRISDSKKFLVKLVGTLPSFDKQALTKYFRGLYLTRVKDAISSYLIFKKISILEINAYLDELSDFMKERIEPTLAEYGIELINFYVNDISIPDDDPGVTKLKDALAKRAEMDIIGYNYQQERSFDTLEGAATNPGSEASGLMGAGIGLGLGVAAGGPIGAQMGGISQILNTSATPNQKECPECHATISDTCKFCPSCGCDTQKKVLSDENQTSCGACGTLLNGNPKFCPECGNALIKKCPNCSTVITGDPKFCSDCGTLLKQ